MKRFSLLLVTVLVVIAACLLVPVVAAPGSTFVDHEKVANALNRGGTLVSTPEYIVLCSHRDKPGQVEVHDKETDIVYVTDGEATLITGGTVVGLSVTKAGQSIGTEIKDGESHRVAKGDVFVIPAGVPHWFKEAQPTISYFVVKSVKP